MNNKRNIYDFNYPSPSKDTGFVLFYREDKKKHYFHLNDENGKVLLYSEGYASKEGRNNGIESIWKNASLDSQYTIEKDKKQYYFTIKATNHQEIARSRYFKTLRQTKKFIKWLQELNIISWNHSEDIVSIEKVASTQKNKKTKATRQTALTGSSKKTKTNKPKSPPLKYNFRIELYARQNEKTIHGRIEDIITGKKETFNGIDREAIIQFMINNLDKNDKKWVLQLWKEDNTTKLKTPATNKIENDTVIIPHKPYIDNIAVLLVNDKTAIPRKHWQSNSPFKIKIHPKNNLTPIWGAGQRIHMNIMVKPIQSSTFRYTWKTNIPIQNENVISMDYFEIPQPGLYHIIAEAHNPQSNTRLKGSTIVNIY